MRTGEEKQLAQSQLTETDKVTIRGLIGDLEKFKERHEEVSLEGYHLLKSVSDSLSVFLDVYITRMIHLLKQGDELD